MTLAAWKKDGVTVAGKFILPEIVRKTYPETVVMKTAFLRFDERGTSNLKYFSHQGPGAIPGPTIFSGF